VISGNHIKVRRKLRWLAGLVISLILPVSVNAQFYNGSQLTFGKNRVQYGEFMWTYFQYERFDTYFYLNGRELAVFVSRYVNEHLQEIESQLESSLDSKIQFIIYNNLSDLKQTNIGLMGQMHYNTGGITHIIGHKVFLYFNGDLNHFIRQIRAGIARIIIEQTLYGGSVGTQIKNTTLMSLPEWYVNGAISYIAEPWSTEIDNYVRDGILSGRYEKFNRLTGTDALYAGHAIWNFIAEKYGKSVVSNILYMSKISRNVESGFLYVLGISYKNLMLECYTYYYDKYRQEDDSRSLPQEGVVLKRTKTDLVYGKITLDPSGRNAAYTANNLGKNKVYVFDLATRDKKKIFRTGYRLDEKVDYTYPIMAWHPSGEILAMITETRGGVFLYLYDFEKRTKIKQEIVNFDKILDFSYSPDGRMFLFSAIQKGQTDLFTYTLSSSSYEQLTNDYYTDLHPRFFGGTGKILFSSNRSSDTLRFRKIEDFDLGSVQSRLDLFMYDYKTKNNLLKRVTQTPTADENSPEELSGGMFTFLSDQNGIINRYYARLDSAITYIDTITHYRYFTGYFPVTNYARNILEQNVNPHSGQYGEIIYKDRKYMMYVNDLPLQDQVMKTELQNTPYATQINNEFSKEKETLKQEGGTTLKKRKRFYNVYTEEAEPQKTEDKIDINNYQFDRQSFVKLPTLDTMLMEFFDFETAQTSKTFKPPKQRNYDVQFSINELVSQIDFSYLNYTYQAFTGGGQPIFQTPGFNAFFNIGVTDLLEDYRITGGVRLSVDLQNNEYLLNFSNLRKRLDKEIIFHRKVFEEAGYYSIIKHYAHELHYVLRWPFNPIIAVSGTATLRNDRAVYLSTDQINLMEPDQTVNSGVLKGELVYDDTQDVGLNLYYGTRFKIFAEYYKQMDRLSDNLVIVGVDFRHYLKIHRTIIWANRFAASTSFGDNKLIYYLGGVDNWVSPKFDLTTPIDYSQNYIYQTLATNMRGFSQNIRNGNSFALINSEIRIPVFRYFANRPLKSDFLNNFQIVGFGDIGTAWTGLNPYSLENSLFTRTIQRPPLLITVELQKEPIVGGFGFGLRSRIFGYFLRGDIAWGVEDWEVLPSQFYFSLCLDF